MNPKDRYLLKEIPETIKAEHTIIRRYRRGDGQAIYDLAERNNNRRHLAGIADDIAGLQTVDEAEVKALRHSAEWLKRDRFVAGIWQGNLFIGEIWIEPAKWEVPSFEIGWFIDKGYEGRGLGYEAAKACLGFIWDELDAHKIIAITDDTNARSYRLAERLGFRKEGHERESGFKDGKRFGRITYGLLKSDMS